MKRKLNFRFDEDQMISALCEFNRWNTGKKTAEEDRGLIASYVMEGNLSLYKVE